MINRKAPFKVFVIIQGESQDFEAKPADLSHGKGNKQKTPPSRNAKKGKKPSGSKKKPSGPKGSKRSTKKPKSGTKVKKPTKEKKEKKVPARNLAKELASVASPQASLAVADTQLDKSDTRDDINPDDVLAVVGWTNGL